MSRPRLLDLFCCAGGSAMGYYRAGFDVTGVDIEPQPHFPFTFVQADALDYIAAHGHEFDVIHASPPCQRYSTFTPLSHRENHADLIDLTRAALEASGRPFVIENVGGARHLLTNPIKLCGTMFGLNIWRHRYFEVWPEMLMLVPTCRHDGHPVLITDHGGPNANGPGKPRKRTPISVKRAAVGIDWMNELELSESIPPAYSEFIGGHLIQTLEAVTR